MTCFAFVILSAAKDLAAPFEMLRVAQHDLQAGVAA